MMRQSPKDIGEASDVERLLVDLAFETQGWNDADQSYEPRPDRGPPPSESN
ncbi:MAG: hypothetical protein R3B96_17040 [Pirellulaceae bacterium]